MAQSFLSLFCFFFSSRRRHTRLVSDWSSDVCSSDLRTSFATFSPLTIVSSAPHSSARFVHLAKTAVSAVVVMIVAASPAGFRAHRERCRSEERRVGKECRDGWWAEDEREEQ